MESFRKNVGEELMLLEQIGEGNESAYTHLYRSYWKDLVKYTNGFMRDLQSSEEIVQELFIQLYLKKISLKRGNTLRSYLQKAVRNRVANHFRNKNNYQKHISQKRLNEPVSWEPVISEMNLQDLQKKVRETISRMPEKFRVVFVLSREHQLTIRQISKKLDKPVDTVEKQLRKALHFLKDQLILRPISNQERILIPK